MIVCVNEINRFYKKIYINTFLLWKKKDNKSMQDTMSLQSADDFNFVVLVGLFTSFSNLGTEN